MRLVIQFQDQQVTRPINAHTHRAPYLPNGKAYELQTWYTDGGRRSASATGVMASKVKCQGHTRPLNADTHRAPYLLIDKAYKFQTWYTDGGRRLAPAIGAMTSKVKGQGPKVT